MGFSRMRIGLLSLPALTVSGSILAAQPAPSPSAPARSAPELSVPVHDPLLAPVPPAPHNLRDWDEALRMVRSGSNDLRTAIASVDKAEAQVRSALASALPSISASGTFTQNLLTKTSQSLSGVGADGTPAYSSFTSPTPRYASGSIGLSMPLFSLQTWDSIGIARLSSKAAQLSLEETKRLLALNVAGALVGVVTAERLAELNRVGLRKSLEYLELTLRKQRLGSANGLDVVRAKQDVETSRATLIAGDESLRQAREALGLGLGVPRAVGVSREVSLETVERDAAKTCGQAGSIDERTDILAAQAQLDAARRSVTNVGLGFLPTLGLVSSLATSTLDSSSSPPTTWSVQGVLSIPIWDGGLKYASRRSAEASRVQAEQKLDSTRKLAIVEVLRARRGVQVAGQARQLAQASRDLAREADRLTMVAFREGQGSNFELIVTASALRQTEIQLALKQFEETKARIVAALAVANCTF